MAKKPKKISIAEKVLKRKQDPEMQKQLAAEQINLEEEPEEIDVGREAITESFLQERETKKRKKIFKWGLVVLSLPFFAYGIHWLFKPFEAGMAFGLCRVFLELHVQYPDKLVLSDVDERSSFVRIWYMQTDAFGQERMENIECHFATDEVKGDYMSKVLIDRRELDPEKVARFNTSFSTIFAYPPDLTYPRRLRDALGNVDIQTYLFRKPIL